MHVLRFHEVAGPTPADGSGETPSSPGQSAIYGPFFGLRERPFTLTPNPKFLYVSTRQREALSSLRYGLSTLNGFTLLTGQAGCGKTTMIRAALAELGDSKIDCVVINNPTLTRAEFYEFLSRAFGLSEQAAHSKVRFLEEMQTTLESRLAGGILTGLVIDEAQSLPDELLEEIRLLGNIDTASAKLLNIVLAGQPELMARLQQDSLQALKQRIALRCELTTFDVLETAAYIAGRLRIAGGLPQEIFTQEAVKVIYETTRGLPRAINVLCENALISGFAEQTKPVPARVLREVASEFEMRSAPADPYDTMTSRSTETPIGAVRSPDAGVPGLGAIARARKRFSFFAMLIAAGLSLLPGTAQGQTPSPPAKPAAAKPPTTAPATPSALPTDYAIGPEDILGIVFWRDADMTGDVVVRPDGMITLPLLGDLNAVGLKPEALRAAITAAAGKYLEDINVTVVVRQINSRKAFITGEVKVPNAYSLVGPEPCCS